MFLRKVTPSSLVLLKFRASDISTSCLSKLTVVLFETKNIELDTSKKNKKSIHVKTRSVTYETHCISEWNKLKINKLVVDRTWMKYLQIDFGFEMQSGWTFGHFVISCTIGRMRMRDLKHFGPIIFQTLLNEKYENSVLKDRTENFPSS